MGDLHDAAARNAELAYKNRVQFSELAGAIERGTGDPTLLADRLSSDPYTRSLAHHVQARGLANDLYDREAKTLGTALAGQRHSEFCRHDQGLCVFADSPHTPAAVYDAVDRAHATACHRPGSWRRSAF